MDVNINPKDVEILWVQPELTGQRVPTAQELAASSHLHTTNLANAQRTERPCGLLSRPVFASAPNRSVVLPAGLSPYAPGHPSLVPFPTPVTVQLPPLASTVDQISRYDYLYLAVGSFIINIDHDPNIVLTFKWASQSGIIQELTKENTRRLRSAWFVVWSGSLPITSADVRAGLPAIDGKPVINVGSRSVSGVAANNLRIYPLDPVFSANKSYELSADTLELIDLTRVWRMQRFNQDGYVWGVSQEADFDAPYQIQPTYRYVGDGWDDWDERTRRTVARIAAGLPLTNSKTRNRMVLNLVNGQVSNNLSAPGFATPSPNGSTALANGQRISFSNQAHTQKNYCAPVSIITSGTNVQAVVAFQANSPIGTKFSENANDHKVFRTDGSDITRFGSFSGLGTTGALVWEAAVGVVGAGETVYVNAAISYPAGSGFPICGRAEKVFLNGVALNSANVLEASESDLDQYRRPTVDNYFVVVGRERCALHYILKHFVVFADNAGTVRIPDGTRGNIAFISGEGAPQRRIDLPSLKGLTPEAEYKILCYYPPGVDDQWQFQFSYAVYAGSGESWLIDGATIATKPIAIAHAHGGGNSCFRAEASIQYEAIAMRMPYNTLSFAPKPYDQRYKIQFTGEPDSDNTMLSYREDIQIDTADGYVLPRVGADLRTSPAALPQTQGVAIQVLSGNSPLGVCKKPIQCSQPYQLLVAFLITAANGSKRVLVVTLNGGDPSLASFVPFDTDRLAGIDTFHLF